MLQNIDVGFQPERVLLVNIPLPPAKYASLEQRNRFAGVLLEGVSNVRDPDLSKDCKQFEENKVSRESQACETRSSLTWFRIEKFGSS